MSDAAGSDELLAGLEAVLMVTDVPVTVEELSDGLGIDSDEVAAALTELAADFDGERGTRARGFRLARAAGGWRIYSRPEHHDVVSAFLAAGHSAKLSQAALETLAVVAYRQPVTRARISAIRGVNVDGVVRTLLLRGLLIESGIEETTGAVRFVIVRTLLLRGLLIESGIEETTGAVRFVTTPAFLESAGLERIEDLPDIAPFLPEGDEARRTGEAGAADTGEFGIMGE